MWAANSEKKIIGEEVLQWLPQFSLQYKESDQNIESHISVTGLFYYYRFGVRLIMSAGFLTRTSFNEIDPVPLGMENGDYCLDEKPWRTHGSSVSIDTLRFVLILWHQR